MYKEEFAAAANAAANKFRLLKKNPLGYFLFSMLAGAYIGFGVLLAFTIGGRRLPEKDPRPGCHPALDHLVAGQSCRQHPPGPDLPRNRPGF